MYTFHNKWNEVIIGEIIECYTHEQERHLRIQDKDGNIEDEDLLDLIGFNLESYLNKVLGKFIIKVEFYTNNEMGFKIFAFTDDNQKLVKTKLAPITSLWGYSIIHRNGYVELKATLDHTFFAGYHFWR